LALYSMFGDPYGGWAFGSRYMIAILPELCLLVGFGLEHFSRNILIKILYSVTFLYSAGVSLLAPLTTNVIPPFVEARVYDLDYTYVINWRMLQNNELNSYFYNHILNKSIPGLVYYGLILTIVCLLGLFLIWLPNVKAKK
jgi:hypothetical protein